MVGTANYKICWGVVMATINLHFGDSLAAMRAMPDQCYDLAIVDPPYGIKRAGHDKTHGWKFFEKKSWDNEIPPPEYFAELRRVSKQQIIWGGNYFDLPPTRCILIWDKCQYNLDMGDGEMAWTSFDRVMRIWAKNRCVLLQEGGTIHPTQKPVALYQWCLEHFAKPGDRILDTHLGSGSIAIACHNMGYDLDAWELDPEYHAAAVARFTQHTQQLQLPW